MLVDEAIQVFCKHANDLGLPLMVRTFPEAFGNSIATAGDDDGQLQLVWDGRDEYLCVRISQAPKDDPVLYWLDQFGAKCSRGVLAQETIAEFKEAIEYCFELMQPKRISG